MDFPAAIKSRKAGVCNPIVEARWLTSDSSKSQHTVLVKPGSGYSKM